MQPSSELGGVSALSDTPADTLPAAVTPTDTTLAGDAAVSSAAVGSTQDDTPEASATPLAEVPTVERPLVSMPPSTGSERTQKSLADEDDTSSLESAIEDLDIPAPPPLS